MALKGGSVGARHARAPSSRWRAAALLIVGAAVIGATLLLAPSVGGAAVAQPVNTQVAFTVTMSTPGGDVGFAATQPVAAVVDANGGTQVAAALVTFAPLELLVNDALFIVELVPNSDLLASVDPGTGDSAFGADLTMLWHEIDPIDGTCAMGPFNVQATTAPFGASAYSPDSGAVTMLDATPSLPAASGCTHADMLNQALSLPATPAPAPPPDTIPVPAITVGASFSPAVQVPDPTVTPPKPKPKPTPTPTPMPTRPVAAPATTSSSSAPQVPAVAPTNTAAVHRRIVARAAPHRTSAKTTTTTTSTTVDTSLNGVRNVVPFPDVGSGAAAPAYGPRARNAAIDPVPASSSGPPMAVVFVGAALVIAAVSFALGLIGRDVRRLLPRRTRRTLDGPISPTPLPPGTRQPHELPWRS